MNQVASTRDARQQAALSAGADAFIGEGETPEQMVRHLRVAALNVLIVVPPANSKGR